MIVFTALRWPRLAFHSRKGFHCALTPRHPAKVRILLCGRLAVCFYSAALLLGRVFTAPDPAPPSECWKVRKDLLCCAVML